MVQVRDGGSQEGWMNGDVDGSASATASLLVDEADIAEQLAILDPRGSADLEAFRKCLGRLGHDAIDVHATEESDPQRKGPRASGR